MIKLGILGFAHGHVFGISREWINHPEYEVEVVCGWDADSERSKKSCADLGVSQAHSAEDVLSDKAVDAVFIASETAFHAQLAVMAAQSGKKILLYKPLGLTMSDADSIVDAVKRYKAQFSVCWQMRVDPVNLKIKSLIDSGELGKPFYYRRRHCLGVHNSPDFKDTWHCDARLNRDIFADDSSHPIDFLNSLFGVPDTVSCEMSTADISEIKNDTGVALFKYSNGMIAEITFCAVCSAAEITSEVYFKNGALQHYGGDGPATRLPHENLSALKWFKEGDENWTDSGLLLPNGQWVRICEQAKPLADFLNGRREPICTAEQGRDSLRMVLACYLSAQNGCRVSLDDKRIYGI